MQTSSNLPMLELPASINYIAAFLTLDCNLSCSYCINDPKQAGNRKSLFSGTRTLPPQQWAQMLNRIPCSDVPITLQGGEPMLYNKGKGIGMILLEVNHYFDLLTNFAIFPYKFIESLHGMQHKFMRNCSGGAQSIRVSYHPLEMKRIGGFDQIAQRCEALREYGFMVSSDKTKSNVAIVMVDHPDNSLPEHAFDVLVERKPFLGTHKGNLYGDYLYPDATCSDTTKTCECRTTELLIDPLGDVWQCHYHLYNKWAGGDSQPVGNMLDPDFSIDVLAEFRTCHSYGKCIGCDVKIKNNRHQSLLHEGNPHTTVEIRNIR